MGKDFTCQSCFGKRSNVPRASLSSGEDAAECGEGLGLDSEVGPTAALLAFDEARLQQHFQMVADGGLAKPERLGEVTDTGLVVGLSLNEAKQPQPSRVGNRF